MNTIVVIEDQATNCNLYRAIDSGGATIDFLLSGLRDADAGIDLAMTVPGGSVAQWYC